MKRYNHIGISPWVLMIASFLVLVIGVTSCQSTPTASTQPSTPAQIDQAILAHQSDIRLTCSLATRLAILSAPVEKRQSLAAATYQTASTINQSINAGTTDLTAVHDLAMKLAGDVDPNKQAIGELIYTLAGVVDIEAKQYFANATPDSRAKAQQALLQSATQGIMDATVVHMQLHRQSAPVTIIR